MPEKTSRRQEDNIKEKTSGKQENNKMNNCSLECESSAGTKAAAEFYLEKVGTILSILSIDVFGCGNVHQPHCV